MVRSTKSAPGSASSAASSTPPVASRRSCQCLRTSFMAIATSQERKLSGVRSPPRASSARSMVSWTTSSTSAEPFRARPTML